MPSLLFLLLLEEALLEVTTLKLAWALGMEEHWLYRLAACWLLLLLLQRCHCSAAADHHGAVNDRLTAKLSGWHQWHTFRFPFAVQDRGRVYGNGVGDGSVASALSH